VSLFYILVCLHICVYMSVSISISISPVTLPTLLVPVTRLLPVCGKLEELGLNV
jgi:hypothetical protein